MTYPPYSPPLPAPNRPRPDGGLPHPLPDRVRVISLWEPYASLVVDGCKTLETRTWPFPYPPSWLVVHASKHIDRGACARLGLDPENFTTRGVLLGLVWVGGPSRPLLPTDEIAACFYEPGRYAWPLEHARRFKTPYTMRGPQKFASVSRDVVLDAMGLP